MYIYMKDCALSVVLDKNDSNQVLVRARKFEDLLVLGQTIRDQQETRMHIRHTPSSDYPYRTFIKRGDFITFMVTSLREMDYTSFKESIEDLDYLHLIHEIHALTKTRMQI